MRFLGIFIVSFYCLQVEAQDKFFKGGFVTELYTGYKPFAAYGFKLGTEGIQMNDRSLGGIGLSYVQGKGKSGNFIFRNSLNPSDSIRISDYRSNKFNISFRYDYFLNPDIQRWFVGGGLGISLFVINPKVKIDERNGGFEDNKFYILGNFIVGGGYYWRFGEAALFAQLDLNINYGKEGFNLMKTANMPMRNPNPALTLGFAVMFGM